MTKIKKNKKLFASILVLILIILSLKVFAIANPYWFDTSWHFRVEYSITNTNYDRDYWPIELDLNFTDVIYQTNKNGTFDIASIRVIEHNLSGGVLFEQPFQFDNATNFNPVSNAAGVLTFFLNGTTIANQQRYFYIYFDIEENGIKTPASYSSNLDYAWDGEEVQINNSLIKWKIDTLRGENTSGLYDVRVGESTIVDTPETSSKTKEYTQFSNGTNNFSFDFRNNATFFGGSLRLVVEQIGNETLWNNPDSVTGFGLMKKRYIFYENSSWIKIEQNFTNIGADSITRNSTSAGGLSLNELSIYGSPAEIFGNITNPFSWYGVAYPSITGIGFINLNYSSNSNFYAKNDTALDRIGFHLDSVVVNPNESITHTAIMQFDDNYNHDILETLKDQMMYPPIITKINSQFIPVFFTSDVNYTIYNRNDTVLIFATIESDDYGIVSSMNVTFDMGTTSILDDTTIMIYDDGDSEHGDDTLGDGIYSNYFNLSQNSSVGIWTVTFRAYDTNDVLLNETNNGFNVTDEYNISLVILNPNGIIGRLINTIITLKDANSKYIQGAEINCTYGAGPLTNITDLNNGTYILNFTAPASTGIYTLNCNAGKFNNSDLDTQQFYAETSETTMSLNTTPINYTSANISLSTGDYFLINVNTTDIGGANAKYVNISLNLPQNISSNSTFEMCGNVSRMQSCIKSFNISIANGTIPGNYTFNISASWINPNLLANTTNISFTTYVLSNPLLNTSSKPIQSIVPDGKNVLVGNFTVYSIGNDNLTNITFNVSGLPDFLIEFSPQNISSLAPKSYETVFANVTIPKDYIPGIYGGIINISSDSNGWKTITLNVTVPNSTELQVQKSPSNYTSSAISLSSGDSFNLTIDILNIGIADSKDANLTMSMPQNISSNSTFEMCGRINITKKCTNVFNITINNRTIPGNYTINMTSNWLNPDLTTNSTNTNFIIQVLSNPILNVSGNISAIISDNSTALAGNFTIYSIGNDNLTNITFNLSGLPDFTITYNPVNVSNLTVNLSKVVYVNVSVPFAYNPGNYSGIINITSIYGGYKTVEINVTVPPRREWKITPESCQRAENPETGTVCLVNIQNTGNAPINFTINPLVTNFTYSNETNMTVAKNSISVVEFLYNVTDVTKIFYYENYTINSTNIDSIPAYKLFNVTLIPYIVPLFSVEKSVSIAKQNNTIEFYVNITDRSTTGINWTTLNVTLPNGTSETFNMTNLWINDTTSSWYFNYSGDMRSYINWSDNSSINISNYTGSTLKSGIYNVTILSQDNTGVIGGYNDSFKIYNSIVIGFTAGSTEYYQGSTGSIYHTITDINGYGIPNANVTITLNDPNNNTIYVENFTTNSNGKISPIPIFSITNDNTVGIYNFTAVTTYYDYVLDAIVSSKENITFNLNAGSAGGGGSLEAKVSTTVVWYPNNIMMFDMIVNYAGNMTTPDNMTLTVYDPVGNIYFNISLSDVNKTHTGYYRYKYAMPMSSASGAYRAELEIKKDGFVDYDVEYFRVSQGGPYDIKITVLPPIEVPLQDYVDFEIYIENMGDVLQDVYIDYWVSYGDNTYYYNAEAVLTPPHVNVTIVRSAYIFSNQPTGLTTLNLKAKYSSVQPPIIATTTFEVIDEDVEIPSREPPDESESSQPVPLDRDAGSKFDDRTYSDPKYKDFEEYEIDIETYNSNINIVRGWTDISGIRVRNAGIKTLHNISLELTGVPSSWFKITPKSYEEMPFGNSTLFLIELNIPETAKSGVYPYILTANSDEASTDKSGTITIFTSIEELIKQDIMSLKIELDKFEKDVRFSEKIGKNVSDIWPIIKQAREQLGLAETNLRNKSFDDALQNVQIVSGLIKKAKKMLEASGDVAKMSKKDDIWDIGLKALIILLIIMIIDLGIIKNKLKLKNSLKQYVIKKPLNKEEVEEKKKEYTKQKEKIQRVLNLLETEFNDGLINSNAYKELKKHNEDKLKNIDKTMSKL